VFLVSDARRRDRGDHPGSTAGRSVSDLLSAGRYVGGRRVKRIEDVRFDHRARV